MKKICYVCVCFHFFFLFLLCIKEPKFYFIWNCIVFPRKGLNYFLLWSIFFLFCLLFVFYFDWFPILVCWSIDLWLNNLYSSKIKPSFIHWLTYPGSILCDCLQEVIIWLCFCDLRTGNLLQGFHLQYHLETEKVDHKDFR